MSYASPNDLYIVFSFIGFVLCAIPFYWHLEAWNTGTCLYMFWTGLGCLMQCVNSIVWNKNMINRVPVYCDISTRIQVALNVAIPACSLCINRRLYKIATVKAVVVSHDERRRALIHDLLIGVGLPVLQMIAQFIVSTNRYVIFEDFGPAFSNAPVPQAFLLFHAWPLAVGLVSLFYCVMTIRAFHKRERQFRQIMSASHGLSRGRYLRLMSLSGVEIIGTIPLATYFIVSNAKSGIHPWTSWADVHAHYNAIAQIAGFIWKNDETVAVGIEIYRWSLVVCAFIFFGFFGFAEEAVQHYRRVYTTIASRIGYSSFTLRGSSHGTSSVVKSKTGVTVSVVTMSGDKRRSSVSFADQPNIPAISLPSDVKPDYRLEQYSPSNTMASSSVESFEDLKMQGQPTLPAGIMPTVPPASFLPNFSDSTKPTTRGYSGANAV